MLRLTFEAEEAMILPVPDTSQLNCVEKRRTRGGLIRHYESPLRSAEDLNSSEGRVIKSTRLGRGEGGTRDWGRALELLRLVLRVNACKKFRTERNRQNDAPRDQTKVTR
ncbi:hypothetical protein HaLaN_18944 [Haematococcus lacustris]|uniref:Uncharacterized protein n=1 Tax=Haematococcus lacustris TaxID=44745 RepID=A0A699ZGB1_HAELA|nr:hypothetical protein HaLaN_18944 [Haematococcus lacustris]